MWKKALVTISVSEIAIIVVNLALVALFGSQFRAFAYSIFGNGDKETLASLLFIEGGLIFGAGAVYFSGVGENVRATHPIVLDKGLEQHQEMRAQRESFGKTLMFIGGLLIIVSVILYLIA